MPKKTKDLVARFSASIAPELMAQYDRMIDEKGYDNRSLAIADTMRAQIIEHRLQDQDCEVAGSLTLIYDHHQRHLQEHLTGFQHDHGEHIISTLHCHLDHHNCLEIIAVRGKASVIKKLADNLIGAKGVKHGKVALTAIDHHLPV